MSTDEHRALLGRLFAELYGGDLDIVFEAYAPEYIGFANGQPLNGPQEVKQFNQGTREAFPDIRATIHEMVVQGDAAAMRWTLYGTHQGMYRGRIAATGKQIALEGINIFHFRNGKIVESWGSWDSMSFLQQLGIMPTA